MEQKLKVQTTLIIILVVFVLTMSIGFAATAYVQMLNFNGTANVTAASWEIAFDQASYTESTGSVAATTHSLTGTTMSYSVALVSPGDFYEFTVNVKNTGTFSANLKSLTMSGLTAAQDKYVTYQITYNNGTTYTTSDPNISGVVLLKNTGTASVKVRIEYVQPADEDDLPVTDQQLNLIASLTYQQVQ
ncbi:MAG: hypothetical protein GX758_02340 [Tenericutes bacterium]|nr:hypothetical protein [Mycoplasmatota bacterium]